MCLYCIQQTISDTHSQIQWLPQGGKEGNLVDHTNKDVGLSHFGREIEGQ